MFSQVLNQVESVHAAGPMACAATASAVGASGTGKALHAGRSAASRMTAGNSVAGLVSGSVADLVSGLLASSRKTGRTHQDGETVTRMVITNLVRPETTRKAEKNPEKPCFFAPGVGVASWPRHDPLPGSSHTPFATVVRSRLGTSMPASAGQFSVVRVVRRSSTNPNP